MRQMRTASYPLRDDARPDLVATTDGGAAPAASARNVQDGVGTFAVPVSTPFASAVGRTTRSILRRRASSRTCFITGNAPSAPVPITSRRHRKGMSSAIESGVGPYAPRNLLDAAFLACGIFPRSMVRS